MYMLTRLFHYSVALGLTAIVLFSCKGKDGDPGPQGDAGAAGAAGAKGQPGGTAVLLTKGGFVKGTLTGFRADGVTPLNETFNFEYLHRNENLYTSSVRETEVTGVYEFNVQRADSLTRSVFRLNFYAPLDLSTNQLSYIEITYNKDLGNNKLLG